MSRSSGDKPQAASQAMHPVTRHCALAGLHCLNASAAGWVWQAMQFANCGGSTSKVHTVRCLGNQQQEALPGSPSRGLPHHDNDAGWPSQVHHAAANNHSVNES